MTPLMLRLWGAVWVGQFALVAAAVLRSLRMSVVYPWYHYFDPIDLYPSAIMIVLALVARSRFKLGALVVWVLVSAFATFAGIATFPNWGDSITDVSIAIQARVVTLSAASEALLYFGAFVLFVSGLGLLVAELLARRARTNDGQQVNPKTVG